MTDRNEGSEPTSSEDLIRQARRAYDPSTFDRVHSDEPAAAPTTETTAPRPAPPSDDLSAEVAAARSPFETQSTPGSDRVTRPADLIQSDYQPAPGVPGSPTTLEAPPRRFFQRFGGVLVAVAIGLGFVVFNMLDKTTSVEDLAIGDCLLMPSSQEITSVESADCTGDHELEVFAVVTLSNSLAAPYPGDDAVAQSVFDRCLLHFEPYVGAPFETSIWWINAIYPTQESWEEADDRAGTCVLYQPGLDDEPRTLTGSARGSAE